MASASSLPPPLLASLASLTEAWSINCKRLLNAYENIGELFAD